MNSKILAGLIAAMAGGSLASGPVQAEPAPTYAVVGHVKAPGTRWDYASFDPVKRRVYVATGLSVTTLDVDSGAVNPAFAAGVRLHSAFALPDGATVVTTNGQANTAELIDAGGAVLATLPTGNKPDAAFYDAATRQVAVMNGHSGDVTLIDPATRTVVGTIAVGGALEFGAADGSGRAFVNVEDKNMVAVLDLKARTVTARYALKGCEGPTGLAYVRSADLVISACANGVAKVVRGATGEEVASLSIGKGPDAVIYDRSRSLAFIPCGEDGVLEVIAVRGPGDVAIVQTVPTQVSARTGAVDEKTGRTYLPAARFGPPAKGAEEGPMIPDSFELLVVAPR
jgi:YVTN family beta-propeller protein